MEGHVPATTVALPDLEPEEIDLTYREWLVKAHHAASEAYDKAVMTLSGGALAISLAFIRDVTPHPHHKGWIAASWSLLAASLLLILVSFLTSQSGLLQAIGRLDKGHPEPHRPWGARLTGLLNLVSCGAFVSGVACLVRFALYNI